MLSAEQFVGINWGQYNVQTKREEHNIMNDRAKYKGRMAIYAMAGVYLLAQAYYMYKDIPTSSGTDKTLMSIFMVVFAVIGAGMVIMGVTKSYKAIKEDYNAVPEEEKKDAETSEGEEAAVEAKEVAELEDKIEESKDASEDADK